MNRAEQLEAFLAEVWGRRYQLGEWDCILFIAAWADRLQASSGLVFNSFTASLRGKYTSEEQGIRDLARHGINFAVRANLVQEGWQVILPEQGFEVGDMVLTELQHPGIWDGLAIVAQPARSTGLLRLHPQNARLGLRWSSIATEKDVRTSS